MPSCRQCGQENPEGFSFCGFCGASLEPAPAPREMRKTVTVVFSDVTGSTALGEQLDPESLRRVMGRYFDEMKAVVESHEGTVEKFIGDAVMAVFGVPVVHEDDAMRAVRAAAEMRTRLAGLNDELERDWGVRIAVRTGVNTGEVVAGDGSGGQRFATGDAVNVAKRFEEAAPPGEILLGETTWRLVRDAVEVEELAPLQLKGKGTAANAFRLLSLEPGAAGRARRLDSPMVGRTRERSLLEQAYARAADERACHLFTILGAAGVGKSRLVGEILRGLGESATVVHGRCLPYGVGITFWPLLEVVRDLVGEESVSAISQRLAADENADLVAERLGGALGFAETPSSTEETFWAARKLLEAEAHERPLVAVFDDLQWGEKTFLDLVEHVADWSRDAPIFLVCLARPELLDERPGWGGGKLNASSVLLERLSEDESTELVENLLGRAPLAEDIRARITEAAEGNPLFVEEMLAMLMDDGLLQRANGGWAATGGTASVAVPPTIQALLAARLDRLAADERSVIERASVEGKLFHRGGVVELSPTGARDSVGTHLQGLVRKELVRPDTAELAGEDAFRFRHQLIRDAAYDGMPKELRAELHERFAGWLEQAAGTRQTEYEEILGYHLEQAHRYRVELAPVDDAAASLGERAAGWLGSAGMRTYVVDPSGAAKLMERAIALLPEEAPLRSELLPAIAQSLFDMGQLERTRQVVERAKATARTMGDRRLETRIALVEALLLAQTDPEFDMDIAVVAENALPVLEEARDDQGLAEAYSLLAKHLSWSGRITASDDAFAKAIEHARRAKNRQIEMNARSWLALNCAYGSIDVAEGLARVDRLLEESQGGLDVEGSTWAARAVLLAIQGQFDAARADMEKGRTIFRELGVTLHWAGTAALESIVHVLAGDLPAAETALRAGIDELEKLGETGYAATLYGMLADVLYAQGRENEAFDVTELCRTVAAASDIDPQASWRRVRARVLARQGKTAEAEELARQALGIIGDTEMLDWHVDTLLSLAEVLRASGNEAERKERLSEALALLERRGNVLKAATVRALLD